MKRSFFIKWSIHVFILDFSVFYIDFWMFNHLKTSSVLSYSACRIFEFPVKAVVQKFLFWLSRI